MEMKKSGRLWSALLLDAGGGCRYQAVFALYLRQLCHRDAGSRLMSQPTYYERSTRVLLREIANGNQPEFSAQLRDLEQRGLIAGHPARLTPAGQAMLNALEAAGEDEP